MNGPCLHCGGPLERVEHQPPAGALALAGAALVRATARPPTWECPACGTIDSADLQPFRAVA